MEPLQKPKHTSDPQHGAGGPTGLVWRSQQAKETRATILCRASQSQSLGTPSVFQDRQQGHMDAWGATVGAAPVL